MINLKYYVSTIVAIFLAIGIGIFIGIMLDGQDLIVQQQEQLVKQLESKFDEFKTKQDELQSKMDIVNLEKEKNIKFFETIYPDLLKNKLKGLNVMIVETNEQYPYSGLKDAFEKAGCENVTKVFVKKEMLLNDNELMLKIAKELNLEGSTKEELGEKIIQAFSSAILTEENATFLEKLKEHGMIDYEEISKQPIDYIVIAGGNVDKNKVVFNQIEVPLIQYIKNNKTPIVAVEQLKSDISNIEEYKKLRVPTVDNVDTIIGKVSMLMVVSGRQGDFGEKETAERLLPKGFVQE
ncbi:copper transporter [Lutibacter sp. B2]|nr:copper transporter [Lutibacter sp. B2]